MRLLIVLLTLIFLSGCFHHNVKPDEDPVTDREIIAQNDLQNEFLNLVENNTIESLQPLYLEEYKEVQYGVVELKGKQYVTMSYAEYSSIMELLQILEVRIDTQSRMIDGILELYRKQSVDSEKVDRNNLRESREIQVDSE